MEYTKEQLGFKETDELEKLIFTSEETYNKCVRFAKRKGIHFDIWIVYVEGHHNESMLMRSKDAARFKSSADQFKNIKLNLLT
jgi:hypothetical protein